MLTLDSHPVQIELQPELGGRITSIRYHGFELLRQPGCSELDSSLNWGSFVMAPWCNREDTEELEVLGKRFRLTPNWPDGSAIHGLVMESPWLTHGGSGHMSIHSERSQFPWKFSVSTKIHLRPQGFRYGLTLRNEDTHPMPAGLGWHPWFSTIGGPLSVRLHASKEYSFDSRYRVSGTPEQCDQPDDSLIPLWGSHRLFTELLTSGFTLTWHESGVVAQVRLSETFSHVLVYASEDFQAIAVEPQSHAPRGLARLTEDLPGAVAILPPKHELVGVIEIDFNSMPYSRL